MIRGILSKLSSDVQKGVEQGVSVLKQGGIVAFPTDTAYGLGACISLPQAVEQIYQAKERPRHMALPVLISDVSQLTKVAESVPAIAWFFVHHFWPGALTLVLRKSKYVPDIVTAGGSTIALRMPAHPVPLALIEGLGTPIVGTSANLSGKPSPLTAEEVYAQLGDKIDLIIDGGRCPGGKESTIVDVTEETPIIMREGAISSGELEKVCGTLLLRREAK